MGSLAEWSGLAGDCAGGRFAPRTLLRALREAAETFETPCETTLLLMLRQRFRGASAHAATTRQLMGYRSKRRQPLVAIAAVEHVS